MSAKLADDKVIWIMDRRTMWTKSRAEQGNISRRRRGRKDARGVKATIAPLLLHAVDVARRGSGLLFGPIGSSSMFHGITMDHSVSVRSVRLTFR